MTRVETGPGGTQRDERTPKSETPILVYHSVCADPPDWIAPYTVTPAAFAAHLDAIRASGRQPLTVSHYADGLRGTASLPPAAVLITVDDGFADFADTALPALAERKMPCTLYVTTGALADWRRESTLPPARMLHSTDLPGLEAAGVEIGAHSHTHRHMDVLPAAEVRRELLVSGTLLAEALGHAIRSFAYPHGYWRRKILPQVQEAGFDSACTVGNSLSHSADRILALPRLEVTAHTDAPAVAAWLAGSGPPMTARSYRASAFAWRLYRRLEP